MGETPGGDSGREKEQEETRARDLTVVFAEGTGEARASHSNWLAGRISQT